MTRAKSFFIESSPSPSGRLAGVTAQASTSFSSRSVARWLLYPEKVRLLLLRPWRISGSPSETRRSGATPSRICALPPPGGSGSRSCSRSCPSVASFSATGGSPARSPNSSRTHSSSAAIAVSKRESASPFCASFVQSAISSALLMLRPRSNSAPIRSAICFGSSPFTFAAQVNNCRAARPSRLKVSSTRPAPMSGLESTANRSVFRQLLRVEAARPPRQLHRTLEQAAVHLVRDEPVTKRTQHSLRKRCFLLAQHPQHHLPAGVVHAQVDRLRIRCARVRLQEGHHRQQCRRHWRLPLSLLAIHRRQLFLKPFVEQFMPVLAQKPEKLLRPPLQQRLLSPAQLSRGIPARNTHRLLLAPCAHGRADHTPSSESIPSS